MEKRGRELVQKLGELKEVENEGEERMNHTRETLAKLEAEENKFKSDRIEIDQQNVKYEEAMVIFQKKFGLLCLHLTANHQISPKQNRPLHRQPCLF